MGEYEKRSARRNRRLLPRSANESRQRRQNALCERVFLSEYRDAQRATQNSRLLSRLLLLGLVRFRGFKETLNETP